MEKEYRFIVRIKNNRMMRLREEVGFTCAQVAEVVGICATVYREYERMARSPVDKKNSDWRPAAKAIANFFCVEPEYLWPESIKAVRRSRIQFTADYDSVLDLMGQASKLASRSPELMLESKEMARDIELSFNELKPRKQHVIKRYYGFDNDNGGPVTFDEVGKDIGVGKERARQICEKSLCDIKRGSKGRLLKEYHNH